MRGRLNLGLEPWKHLCGYCLKRLSLGETEGGWLGCVVCQREVDEAIIKFLKEKFG